VVANGCEGARAGNVEALAVNNKRCSTSRSRSTASSGCDHWLRVDTCDYPVDPAVIGRRAEIVTDVEQVLVR
jgi:hypothetical protein